MHFDHERLIFLDFEACSLSQNSWPIEIGMSSLVLKDDAYTVKTWDRLIKPDDTWSMSAWSHQSQGVHNISRADLDAGVPAHELAETVREKLRGKVVISDSPPHETYWLNTLLCAGQGAMHLIINDFDQAAFSLFKASDYAVDMIFETLERTHAPHRAGPDSARLAKAWVRGIQELNVAVPTQS